MSRAAVFDPMPSIVVSSVPTACFDSVLSIRSSKARMRLRRRSRSSQITWTWTR